ncbi:hypothetical protein [Kineococcus radiotolerans]|uniref:Uncharacterized protein n=1 Tax=Kineococcus radiotolerans (strain ATCC BAA-149 / DSM 14245 / SRS30216) TaxID=266940 RepID=A6WAT9_KINRD|nr:hypothetical protein [Kineococcus radiotolerans]ABS03928.1 hypothetical protein Krad_2449 [Kineococcus radiotolerans SRS30216 = ATCC BAA-149]
MRHRGFADVDRSTRRLLGPWLGSRIGVLTSVVLITVAAGTAGSIALASSAVADSTPPKLRLDSQFTRHGPATLAPGRRIHWEIEATLEGGAVGALELQVASEGALVTRPDGLWIQVRTCDQRWLTKPARCPGNLLQLLAPQRLADVPAETMVPVGNISLADSQWVLVTMNLPENASAELQGASGRIGIGLTASGDDTGVPTPTRTPTPNSTPTPEGATPTGAPTATAPAPTSPAVELPAASPQKPIEESPIPAPPAVPPAAPTSAPTSTSAPADVRPITVAPLGASPVKVTTGSAARAAGGAPRSGGGSMSDPSDLPTRLARTGAELGPTLGLALGAIAAGLLLSALARRHRSPQDSTQRAPEHAPERSIQRASRGRQ